MPRGTQSATTPISAQHSGGPDLLVDVISLCSLSDSRVDTRTLHVFFQRSHFPPRVQVLPFSSIASIPLRFFIVKSSPETPRQGSMPASHCYVPLVSHIDTLALRSDRSRGRPRHTPFSRDLLLSHVRHRVRRDGHVFTLSSNHPKGSRR